MKVVVCGAGQVGFNIARYLSEANNDVTVIDNEPDMIRKIADALDVRCVLGYAPHPPVLEQAGAADADLIIAVTDSDETNMVVCEVAHALFDVPTKIARIRSQCYLLPVWSSLFSRDNLPIDFIISPEIEVARAIIRRLQVPGAQSVIPLANDRVRMIGVRCGEDCPLIRTPLRQLTVLFPDLNLVVIAIVRDGSPVIPTSEFQMLPGDEVVFVVESRHVPRAMIAFGHEEPEVRKVVILGGGNVGLFVAQELESKFPNISAKIIEADAARAEEIAKTLKTTLVLRGDVLDRVLLEEAAVGAADMTIAVTNDDETNILSALLAKRHGCRRAMSLVNRTDYSALMSTLGIDVVISPRDITVSNILQHVRRGRIYSVHSLFQGFGELIEADALETSGLVGKALKEVKLPHGVLLGAVVRDDKVISPRGNTIVQTNDRVVLFAVAAQVKRVEKMFSVGLEYF
jgi:trk system potassium uptake protein TrkA